MHGRVHWMLGGATVVLAGALMWALVARGPQQPRRRPNVVLISLDTLRPDHLGCYGYGRGTSPNLDRFARRSVLFRRACAQAPWTLPSHMSLFTSMLPSRNRVEDINEQLPDDVPTLAQILRAKGYHTAALVNNGQMRAHWGFDRGFDLWREYEVDTPEGTCENLTAEALRWLAASPQEPFFLFLHYYDPHDPYDPPPRYLEQFGCSLSGQAARDLVWAYRYPGKDIEDERLLREIVGAYDAEIAWLDEELGRLLDVVPDDALTVIFSDHGEAFEEHGWTTHGAALYQEEVRAALMINVPDRTQPQVIQEPVMLLDVAPTILSLCGIEPPAHYEGCDLTPLMEGGSLPARPILAETKRVLEGRVLKMCMSAPWKLIYSLFDGSAELYRLPDEQADLSVREPERRERLLAMVREWLAAEDFWIVYAAGKGTYQATVATEGRLGVFIPLGVDLERDGIRPSRDGRRIQVTLYPQGGTKGLYFELSPRDARVSFEFRINGQQRDDMVFYEPGEGGAPRSPFLREPFRPAADGFHVLRYGGEAGAARSPRGVTLDEETIQHLRSLGYLE